MKNAKLRKAVEKASKYFTVELFHEVDRAEGVPPEIHYQLEDEEGHPVFDFYISVDYCGRMPLYAIIGWMDCAFQIGVSYGREGHNELNDAQKVDN